MWKNGQTELNTERFSPSLAMLLDTALERAVVNSFRSMNEADILYSLLTLKPDEKTFLSLNSESRSELTSSQALVENYMADGVRLKDCRAAFEACSDTGTKQCNPFLREFFCEPLGSWLDDMDDGANVTDFLRLLFARPDSLPQGYIISGLFRCSELYASLALAGSDVSLFDDSGKLNTDLFRSRANYLLEQSMLIAAKCGKKTAAPGHLMAAMLICKESYTYMLLRRGGVKVTGAKILTYLQNTFPQTNRLAAALPPVRQSISDELIRILDEAMKSAFSVGQDKIGEREMLQELLKCGIPQLEYIFEAVLKIDPKEYLMLLSELKEPEIIEPNLPLEICECRSLSSQEKQVVMRRDVVEAVVKVFFRKNCRNVLLHGDHGIGLSSVADMVAQELRSGAYSSLRHIPVIRFDLTGVKEDEYEQAVNKLLNFFDDEPDRVYALEGFGKYLVGHTGEVFRRLSRNACRLIITISETEFTQLEKETEQLIACMTPIGVSEPGKADAIAMIDMALPEISAEYGVQFSKGITQVAYRMANDYLISQRFPQKAINILSRAASDEAAEAEMRGKTDPVITKEKLASVMSGITGLPAETILGTGADKDYVYLLSQNLVGQEAAVSKVAGRLDLIQKGMVDKAAPAAVFVFAGLSGTGKTELAKQIAQIYSNSRKLISFSMENFGEAHSVSRLIGTPPGYVGYEEGGKLINDLNKDPYSVVLLDEVEKAHPAVWDPFLNLFDEGVITDMRGVSASGSKAFFVLTSNIGQYEIADMLRRGCPMEEIENTVRNKFNTEVHKKSGEKCFRPEFIGRIMRRGGIVVFNALSLEALKGIAAHNVNKIAKSYGETHDSKLVCDDDVLEMIAKIVYEKNEEAIRRGSGYFGGRELDSLVNQFIQEKLASQIRQLAGVPLVRVVRSGNDTAVVPVYNDADAQKLIAQKRLALVDKVTMRFDKLGTVDTDVFSELDDDKLTRLNALLSEIDVII